MSAANAPGAMGRGEFVTLVFNLTAAHTIGTIATMTLPAIAPIAAQAYGVPVYMVGYQAIFLALGIIIALVFGGNLSLRWGPTRVNQAGLTLLAAGTAMLSIPSVVTAVPAALGIGIGYGALTPSASHILVRFTPTHRRNIVFSLKQSGVPLGGVLTAMIMPAITVTAGWQWALWINAVAALSMALLMERWRKRWDDDRVPSTPLAANPVGAMAIIWRQNRLRLMAIGGAGIVISQICMQNYTVAMFYEQFSMPLVQAGLILTVAQIGGVCGRLFWGWYADRIRDALLVMLILAGTLILTTLSMSTLSEAWPQWSIYLLFLVLGMTASGWNGVFLGEVARLAPAGQVSPATGGALFFVNLGSTAAPILFATAYTTLGSYSASFGLLVLPSIAAMACMYQARRLGTLSTGAKQ
jgi:MFS family permease